MVQRTDQNSGRKSYAYKGFVNYATKVFFFFFSWACSFSKYLLSTYYMPGTITTGNRASNRKRHHSCFPGASCSYLVTQSCLTLCDPMDCRPPGSSVHGILQARLLEQVAIPSSRGSSELVDWTWVSCAAGRFFTIWATRGSLCSS